MAKKIYIGISKPSNKKSLTLTTKQKDAISAGFSEIIDDFKNRFISKEPNKMQNYLADIFPAWYQSNFYLVEKFKNENPTEYSLQEFDEKFLRIQFNDIDKCKLSYKRYTGQWWDIAESITLDDCKKMIVDNPVFHPIG